MEKVLLLPILDIELIQDHGSPAQRWSEGPGHRYSHSGPVFSEFSEQVDESALFQAEEITNLKKQLNLIYVKHTGQELETIHNSLERDKFMNPQQALEFGLIDKVLEHPPKAGAEADKKE